MKEHQKASFISLFFSFFISLISELTSVSQSRNSVCYLPQLFLHMLEHFHHLTILHEYYPSYFFLTFLCSYSPFLSSCSKKLLGGIAFAHFFISYLVLNQFFNKSGCSFFSPLWKFSPMVSNLPKWIASFLSFS